jgi:hypothetical protein
LFSAATYRYINCAPGETRGSGNRYKIKFSMALGFLPQIFPPPSFELCQSNLKIVKIVEIDLQMGERTFVQLKESIWVNLIMHNLFIG